MNIQNDMYERKLPTPIGCGLYLTREILNGKWKANLISAIASDVKRPSDIIRLLSNATKRVINVQLKELEDHGIITKKIYHQLPPKVEYSLTTLGESLIPVIDAMNLWGNQNREILENVITTGHQSGLFIKGNEESCSNI